MSRTISIRFLAAAIFCLALGAAQIFAQSTVTGGIRGKITDPQGAILPNASVTVTNTGTNATATATTDEDGGYRFANLQPGTYTIGVTATGFANFSQERVVVEVGQVTSIDVPLSLAGQTGTVTVTAEAPVINTNDNANATNINQTSINELPINGRRASNFVLLTPATVPDGTFGLISFRGISGLLNNSTVDGGDNNQAFFSEERGRTRINYSISQSAVREFQVNGSNYSAEYGRAAGGVVNTVTKSGTNDFHGDLFYYNRNNRNGARNPRQFQSVLVNGVSTLVAVKPVDLREQFGAAVGGPIIKNRLFFFFSYDQQRRNFPGLAAFSNPTFLNGADTALLTTPLGQQVAGRAAGVLGRGLTAAQVNNTLTFLNSLTGETPRRGDQRLFLPKIDWQINNNNLFSATYNRLRYKSPAGIQTQAVNFYGRNSFGNDFVNTDTVNLRLQSTLSATMLNEARFQYGRDFEFEFSQQPLPGEPTGVTTSQGLRAPNVFLSGGLQFGTPSFLERAKYPDERRIQFADTVTMTRGRHTFKFGGDVNRVGDDTQNLRYEAGGFSYGSTGLSDFIIDYTNFLTPLAAATPCATSTRLAGRCYNGSGTNNRGFNQGFGIKGIKFNTFDYNFFAQDDFRITPRLTVNLGLRYEYEKLPKAMLANSSAAIIPNIDRTLADATSTLPSDKNNFGPRIGFAYDVFGDGKTSIRGGYGIYYGRIINSTIYSALTNTGNANGQFQINLPASDPNAPEFGKVLTSLPSSLSTSLGAIQFFQRNFQAPLINQYDFIVERQIAKNTVVSASYIGSLGRNLPTFINQNLKPAGTTTTFTVVGGPFGGQTYTTPNYTSALTTSGELTEIQSSVKSEYNALVLQANRRFTSGLQFQTSYTLSKSTDTGQTSQNFTTANVPLDIFNRSFDAGPSNFDVRHKVVVSAVYAPTFYKGDAKSFYNYLFNGYQIAPIIAYYSGRPYDGNSGSLNGTNGDSRLPLNSRNAFRLPSVFNVDLRLSKRLRFTERYNLELIAEGFNIFNRTQVFGVNTTLYSRSGTTLNYNQNFGQVTATDSTLYRERQIQFAARFQF